MLEARKLIFGAAGALTLILCGCVDVRGSLAAPRDGAAGAQRQRLGRRCRLRAARNSGAGGGCDDDARLAPATADAFAPGCTRAGAGRPRSAPHRRRALQ